MGDGLQQFLPFGWIIDLGEFLRQVQVIPADDAILVPPSDADLPEVQRPDRRTDSADFRPRKQKSLEVYQHLSLESVDKAYQDAVQSVGI